MQTSAPSVGALVLAAPATATSSPTLPSVVKHWKFLSVRSQLSPGAGQSASTRQPRNVSIVHVW